MQEEKAKISDARKKAEIRSDSSFQRDIWLGVMLGSESEETVRIPWSTES